jgi:hypothetical protein
MLCAHDWREEHLKQKVVATHAQSDKSVFEDASLVALARRFSAASSSRVLATHLCKVHQTSSMGNCVSPAAEPSSKSEISTTTKEKKGKKVKLLLLGATGLPAQASVVDAHHLS